MADDREQGGGRKPRNGDISWNQGLLVAGLAMTIPGLLFAPPATGYWLDTMFGTYPWITVTGFVVGLIATALDVWQILRRVGLVE